MRNPLKVEMIAKLAHEINRAYCCAIGDNSQPAWEDAPQWQKTSARDGVIFHLDNPGSGPQASHKNWMKEKIAAGWKYGPIKNAETKEHPCLVAFEALPAEHRAKDYLFAAAVASLSGTLNKSVTRTARFESENGQRNQTVMLNPPDAELEKRRQELRKTAFESINDSQHFTLIAFKEEKEDDEKYCAKVVAFVQGHVVKDMSLALVEAARKILVS